MFVKIKLWWDYHFKVTTRQRISYFFLDNFNFFFQETLALFGDSEWKDLFQNSKWFTNEAVSNKPANF